jgi:hypothetical protein
VAYCSHSKPNLKSSPRELARAGTAPQHRGGLTHGCNRTPALTTTICRTGGAFGKCSNNCLRGKKYSVHTSAQSSDFGAVQCALDKVWDKLVEMRVIERDRS